MILQYRKNSEEPQACANCFQTEYGTIGVLLGAEVGGQAGNPQPRGECPCIVVGGWKKSFIFNVEAIYLLGSVQFEFLSPGWLQTERRSSASTLLPGHSYSQVQVS